MRPRTQKRIPRGIILLLMILATDGIWTSAAENVPRSNGVEDEIALLFFPIAALILIFSLPVMAIERGTVLKMPPLGGCLFCPNILKIKHGSIISEEESPRPRPPEEDSRKAIEKAASESLPSIIGFRGERGNRGTGS